MSVISPSMICCRISSIWLWNSWPSALISPRPDALGLEVEDLVLAAREGAVLDRLRGLEHRRVDALHGRGQDVLAQVALVGVDADAEHALLLRRVERPEAAAAGDLEDDLRALGDLVERDLLALGLVDEVLRVGGERLDALGGLTRGGLVAGDVRVDRRDLLAADRRQHLVSALLLDHQRGEVARQVAGLVLLEQQAADVGRLALESGLREVDDREVRVRELLRHGVDRFGHQEAHADHEVVLLLREPGEVRHIVGVRLRRQRLALDAELGLGLLEALVGELVERAVVEAADVGHDADLDGRLLLGLLGTRPAGGLVLVLTASRGDDAKNEHERRKQDGGKAALWHFLHPPRWERVLRRRQPSRSRGHRRSAGLASTASLTASSAKPACTASRVTSISCPSSKPWHWRATAYSVPILHPK